ncbi:hypothetical protein [Nocardia aurantia]|uniref:Uncharacterized protein n=1 Tax=Nocardia aurantia TaxID=2585199 RepID=A0A7K0DUG6_9NOCA|nr:hypothetical protein [Nocardia aurantia]MQY29410.1 hypothetical protein [Nocardia aurantia]
MVEYRKRGVVPVLILVPAVAGVYLSTSCGLPAPPERTESQPTPVVATIASTVPQNMSTTSAPAPTTTRTTTIPARTTTTSAQAEDVDFAAVCADAVNGTRVDDSECDDADENFPGDDDSALNYAAAGLAGGVVGAAMWYYLSVRNHVVAPAIGERVRSGGYATPMLNTAGRMPVIYRFGSVDTGGGMLSSSSVLRGGLGWHPHSGRT